MACCLVLQSSQAAGHLVIACGIPEQVYAPMRLPLGNGWCLMDVIKGVVSSIPSWFLMFLVILIAGLVGGWARYRLDRDAWEASEPKGRKPSFHSCAIIGVIGSFLVPLFLNMISSTLIKDTNGDIFKGSNLFVLIGFCLIAAIFAKRFMWMIANKAFQEVMDKADSANKHAQAAEHKAESAEVKAAEAINRSSLSQSRSIAVIRTVYKLFDDVGVSDEDIANIIVGLKAAIDDDVGNAEAWAWLAYCQKRIHKYEDAVCSMAEALNHDGEGHYKWYFNLACYKCLANRSVKEIIEGLQKATKSARSAGELKTVVGWFDSDEDLSRIREEQSYKSFRDGLL